MNINICNKKCFLSEFIHFKLNTANGDQNVSVISVVGIGGLGKTVLAKLVFNDATVVKHFELKCWVCMLDEFVLKQLLVKIVESISGENRNDLGEEQLQIRLRDSLAGRNFY